MKIGFDLDKIFIDTPVFIPDTLINKVYKKRDNGVLLYRIPGYAEQLVRKATHLPFFRPALKENLAFLKSIQKKQNKIFLISSRYKFLEKETTHIIKKYHFDKLFDTLFFNYENKQPHLFKNDVLKKLQLDMYIDDDLSLLKYVAKSNVKTKFFWLNHKKEKKVLPKNITSITQLKEIFTK